MSEDIIKYETRSLENFQRLLNQYPPRDEIKVNRQANNYKYIPIGRVERVLDELYGGLWKVEKFRTEVIANEIIGIVELSVFHPVAKVWLTRTGSAAVMIQTRSGKPPTVDNKIINTLGKDFPSLLSRCVANAARSLGVRFGRGLNHDYDDEFSYLSEQVDELTQQRQVIEQLLDVAQINDRERERIRARLPRMTARTMADMVTWLQARC
jgi:hypothetical protein